MILVIAKANCGCGWKQETKYVSPIDLAYVQFNNLLVEDILNAAKKHTFDIGHTCFVNSNFSIVDEEGV